MAGEDEDPGTAPIATWDGSNVTVTPVVSKNSDEPHFTTNQRLELDQVKMLHIHKTGMLIAASLKMGAIIVGRDDIADSLYDFGIDLGLLFQIQDDILDVTQDSVSAGKTTNNDEANMTETKKGFWNTITFGLFAGNKSSSGNGKMRNVKSTKAKTRSIEAPVNKKAQKARKKQNKRLVDEQKKIEKAQKKYDKKSEKN